MVLFADARAFMKRKTQRMLRRKTALQNQRQAFMREETRKRDMRYGAMRLRDFDGARLRQTRAALCRDVRYDARECKPRGTSD